MSYCRFSSDNWKSDVYVYEDVSGGWTTHVAGAKRATEPPNDRFSDFLDDKITAEEFVRLHKDTMAALETIPLIPIDLPHAGESFSDSGPKECAEPLIMLRGLGYHVPQYAIDDLLQEAKDASVDGVTGGVGLK